MRRFIAIFRLSWRRLAMSLDMVFPFLPPAYSFGLRLVRIIPFAIARSGIERLYALSTMPFMRSLQASSFVTLGKAAP